MQFKTLTFVHFETLVPIDVRTVIMLNSLSLNSYLYMCCLMSLLPLAVENTFGINVGWSLADAGKEAWCLGSPVFLPSPRAKM